MPFVYCSKDTPCTPGLLALTAADGPDCLPTALASAVIANVGNLAPTQRLLERLAVLRAWTSNLVICTVQTLFLSSDPV